ncbi:MAG: aminotransferase class III-fold pyridoxal phosphate-dependent enzyme [Thaumarchaeota archaeon]|nr:aminotransferase class III-fold pyridoxal phosphate-dependent enzyme [Nitrososphaerota archaeon]MDD9842547.1 aminotransferase class III-fold pyridoxal phosphate-dependent enzyme [Nitrososphaerota archaeon]
MQEDAEAAYRRRTPRSRRLHAASSRLHVNGVHHNIRHFDPYPFVAVSARAQRITDADSNRYTDYWMGHWSLILGHSPPAVGRALAAQLARGWMHGTLSKPSIELSEEIARSVRVAEKTRYTASGTEAVMYATRIARARTGRRIVAKVGGGWHGYASDVLKSVNWPFGSESRGVYGERNIVTIPHNDLEGSVRALRRAGRELACIVVEPLLGGGGCVPSTRDYMRGLQEFARSRGALLVLDEIVTGFRFRHGCLYPTMGLDPDIVTLGKIAGGGMPMGAMCGKDEVMQVANTSEFGKASRSYVGGGTFSANPASMAAGLATLRALRSRASVYERIGRMGEMARRGLERALDGRAVTTGRGSLFMAHFSRDGRPVRSAGDAARCDAGLLRRFHFEMIARDGIFFLPGKLGAVSAAHTPADVRALVRAAGRFSASLRGGRA